MLIKQDESELFKWFLQSLLYGKPIQQKVAERTFNEFIKAGLDNPEAILTAGWEKLVEVLDRGHYVRYDFSTADKLLAEMMKLEIEYGGEISYLIKISKSKKEARDLLQEFPGIGPKTTEIFLKKINN